MGKEDDEMNQLARLWQDAVAQADVEEQQHKASSASMADNQRHHPAVYLGFGSFVLVNLAMLLSLPPVLRGKGAPYLPTYKSRMDAMFAQLRREPSFQRMQLRLQQPSKVAAATTNTSASTLPQNSLTFVDLGSGDGRFVFRAAREGLFCGGCIGYEINPILYLWSQARRLAGGPRMWRSTHFYCRDIWKVDLRQTNVIAVVSGSVANL